ncbi:hypothetical protein PU629_00315 [Pullulanibacillus sp. KACC 23026]|uniref:hypothetical protein n=1 Tax=Pullulanibacillus sp. KACC 23026 TaxID=3028315 RepID=UPI0023AE9A24|nr:hypothetical protein [Pullulanibacillus sp. KACC 23026]WEG12836.1 hypothetical protein PU629_00315 [Pullulanibacillus sp. KACC 23026]
MKRTFERTAIYIACIWQLVTGSITLFFYSYHLKAEGDNMTNLSPLESASVHSVFSNLYTFTITYGLFFIVLAIVNCLLTRSTVKDQSIQFKMPTFWLILAVIYYFLSDFISVFLFLAAGIIAFSKNKPTKNYFDLQTD